LIGPDTVVKLLRFSNDPHVILALRFLGGSLAGLGMLAWYARDFTDLKARDGAAVSLFLACVLGFIVALLATAANTLKVAGWPIALIFLGLAASIGYLQFLKRAE
jgi:hypothetical protein